MGVSFCVKTSSSLITLVINVLGLSNYPILHKKPEFSLTFPSSLTDKKKMYYKFKFQVVLSLGTVMYCV
jgi:hypothetical protein